MERFAIPQSLSRPLRHDVPDQSLPAGLVFGQPHHGVPDAAVLAQHPLDFTELDPVAVQLHLIVDPTAELDHPVREVACHIARAIQSSARIRIERVRYEFFSRQLGAIQVAPTHPGSPDAQLPLLAHRYGLSGGVEDVDSGVGQRRPQRERAGPGRRQVGADVIGQRSDGGLRGAIVVVDLARGREGAQPLDPIQPRSLASENQTSPGHDVLRIAAGLQSRQMRRHDLQDVDLLAPEVFGQQGLVLGPLLRDDVQAAARGQRRENHGVAEIGGNGRHRGMLHPGLEAQSLADP